MITFLKIAGFLIIVGLVGWVVWANTQPVPDEPCDYKDCPLCPFPCERNRK